MQLKQNEKLHIKHVKCTYRPYIVCSSTSDCLGEKWAKINGKWCQCCSREKRGSGTLAELLTTINLWYIRLRIV